MCYSFESSLFAGWMSYIVAGFLMWRNHNHDQKNAIFLASFSTLQFVDSILWYDDAEKGLATCSSRNWFTSSILIPLFLCLQQLVSTWTSTCQPLPQWWSAGLLFVIGSLWHTYYNTYTVMIPGIGLMWGNHMISLQSFLLFYLYLFRPRSSVRSWLEWFITTWYLWVPFGSLFILTPNFGSKWCFMAAATSFLFLFDTEQFKRVV